MANGTITNGIDVSDYCPKCCDSAEKDTTCYKCRTNQRIGKKGVKDWNFCTECLKEQVNSKKVCSECQMVVRWGNEKGQDFLGWEDIEWKGEGRYGGRRGEHCSWDCRFKASERERNKPNNQDDDDEENSHDKNESCERCNKQERHWAVFWYSVNFTKEIHYFGENCPCFEQWKKETEQTCPQCKKKEWPDMRKGWMLDYEIKKAFCSPLCHVTYRQLSWEETQKLKQIELITPPLAIPSNIRNNQHNFDWEKEGLRREVLFWREYARELEQRLNNQNLTLEERQQSNYLRNLQQNTLSRAENNYRNKYGSLVEDKPKSSDNKDKSLSSGAIALIVVGGITVVGVIIALLVRSRRNKVRKK